MKFFGSHQRKTLRKVETHLIAENTQGACAGSVVFSGSLRENMFKKCEIGLHTVLDFEWVNLRN